MSRGCLRTGIQKPAVFLKIAENRRNWTSPNLKTAKNTVHYFKISEKDKKNQQNICKKTRSNSNVTGEEVFVKLDHLGW
jgi:hypothetical protein